MIKRKFSKNKSGISLMISYVILISIVVAVSIGVFTWLKVMTNINPPTDCKEDTSLILNDYECLSSGPGNEGIILHLKNNGRFNIDGIIFTVSNNTQRDPTINLISDLISPKGYHLFESKLKPGQTIETKFFNEEKDPIRQINKRVNFDYIRVVKIQPFIMHETGVVVCKSSIIKQNLENCKINYEEEDTTSDTVQSTPPDTTP